MFGILAAVTVPNAGVYATLDDLLGDLTNRTQKDGYKIVKLRSHRSRPGEPVMRVDLCCERGGQPYKCAATKHKTSTKKTDCPWKAKAVDRKTVGGWVLTVICDQHNHEPGTPEPPTPSQGSEAEDNDAEEDTPAEGPQPDPETAAALQVAGVSDSLLRLSGDTFHKFKNDYRKMSQPDRIGMLAQLQLRIAAIYALQNEDLQRQKRQEAQDRRHQEIEESRRRTEAQNEESMRRIASQNEERTSRQRNPPPSAQAGAQLMFHNANARQTRMLQRRSRGQQQPQNNSRQYAQIAPTPAPPQPQFEPIPSETDAAPATTVTPVPYPLNVRYRVYPGPPKRIRGGRQSQGGMAGQRAQQTAQQSGHPNASGPQQTPQQSSQSTPSIESSS
ncbi:Transcription factor, FAR1-related protein [Purpureocillium lilacinum]|uniref:Transcription factor, FAR1-related protein n=1 Tax=Purpureocillium lilacinum TaxID=33203 RepID=A0A179HBZ8_PURLI|nr:hypothetical protein Purlil1_6260 [Purpureocillium lilacinum]OAQ87747.1 transcription factor, FAR1-related protein [Purpureocillium lilacinum]PWI71818.1 Transcription factor, FAR1-related protein [Purpureocillium lilacinum]GJN66104.1 hypothetical protein PLICBS_000120 [Purpureocillium lilacinum]